MSLFEQIQRRGPVTFSLIQNISGAVAPLYIDPTHSGNMVHADAFTTPNFRLDVRESFASTKGRAPIRIDKFDHSIDAVVRSDSRSIPSGKIVKLAPRQLDFAFPADEASAVCLLSRVHPGHLGEVGNEKGHAHFRPSFVVDSNGQGWLLPKITAYHITDKYFGQLAAANPRLTREFLYLYSNRTWKPECKIDQPRTETVVCDSFYFKVNNIPNTEPCCSKGYDTHGRSRKLPNRKRRRE